MGRSGGGGIAGLRGRALKPKQYARLPNEVKCTKATIYAMWSICYNQNTNYVNTFLSTNPTTLILSSLVSDADKESISDISDIKLQAPTFCGSLLLKQTKGVTDRKGHNSANVLRNLVKS